MLLAIILTSIFIIYIAVISTKNKRLKNEKNWVLANNKHLRDIIVKSDIDEAKEKMDFNQSHSSGIEVETFQCMCWSFDHTMRVAFDDEDNDLYISFHLSSDYNIFKRIWLSLNYILNRHSFPYGEVCWTMRAEDKERFIKLIDKKRTG